jgi:hypothetical protein
MRYQGDVVQADQCLGYLRFALKHVEPCGEDLAGA